MIVWNTKAEPLLQYKHDTSVQVVTFNPINHHLFSGSNNDFGLLGQDQKKVEKTPVNSKILCAAWAPDGNMIVIGLYNGNILFREKDGKAIREVLRKAPVWCLEWNPIKSESQESVFAVGCWDSTLSFYNSSGKQISSEDKKLDFDPCCISYFANGEFFVMSGSNKKVTLWTKEGVCIGTVAEESDWIWACQLRPKHNSVAIGSNDGVIGVFQMSFNVVHGLFQDRYAYRELMTDVIIQHLVTEQKVRIKCRDLVKKIAVYKDRIAIQLPEHVLLYAVSGEDEYDMRYKRLEKIQKKLECSLLVLTYNHFILCQDRRLQLMSFTGELIREWVLDGLIRYIKVIGGPQGREGVLVGLKNGHILKIFIDNPFPVTLIRQHSAIRCLDISCDRKKLAVVDDNHTIFVYDLITQEMIFQDSGVSSVAWNTEMEDILAYSGDGTLSIKTGPFPPSTQKMLGYVVGFKGSKIFSLHYITMNTIDVPQTAAMYKYLEQKQHEMAYKVACLGVTEQDWRSLAIESIQAHKFPLAKKAFIRIKDIRFLELLVRIEQDRKNPGYNDHIMMGDVAAYQGRYNEAAALYEKGNDVMRAVEMFKELKMWEKAQEFVKKLDKDGQKKLLLEQAADTEQTDWKSSATLFLNVADYKKAVQIIGKHGDLNWLIEICRGLNKSDNSEAIQMCANIFRHHGNHSYAKEAYLKLGDIKALLNLHVELGKWEEAFRLAKQNPELQPNLYQPYAEYLIRNDKFEEALDAYKKANRHDIALRLLERLTKNAVNERRFNDAGEFFWKLAKEHLRLIKDCLSPTTSCALHFNLYEEYKKLSDMYHAYSYIQKYIEEPFLMYMPGVNYEELVFNACRFLLNCIPFVSAEGISKLYIYYALGKLGARMQAFKTSRTAYEKLQSLKVPTEWQEEIDLATLTIRAKPYTDREDLFTPCSRCMNTNTLINLSETGDICSACKHPIIRSFITFTPLPLVEFEPLDSIPSSRVDQLLRSQAASQPTKGRRPGVDGWHESTSPYQQSLQLDNYDPNGEDLFTQKVMEWAELQMTSEDYRPVVVDEATLASIPPEEVFIIDYTKECPSLPRKFFRIMIPDVDIILCKECGHFFLREEYDYAYLYYGGCPVCKAKEEQDSNNIL